MQNDNEIAQILRDILEVLRDSNAQIKKNVAEAKARADEARELNHARLDGIIHRAEDVSKQTTKNLRRSVSSLVVFLVVLAVFAVSIVLRMLGMG
jgi:ElaB/YqjD/DUF883 family membrane-anchored ribosome-binding protein